MVTRQLARPARFSLSMRVSVLLMAAAILPLLFTVTFIVLLSRPTLVAQASKEMETDAQTRAQLIDNYFSERILDAESLSRQPAIQNFVAGNGDPALAQRARDGLATGHGRGSHYDDWSLFDLHGNLLLSYPTPPQMHGNTYIDAVSLPQMATTHKALISPIFYNATSNEAYIDIYTPVVTTDYNPVGVLRTSFDLSYIWKIVNNEADANGHGTYAFILDQNGVRIAYTNPNTDPAGMTKAPHLFTAIAPLSKTALQQVNSEAVYGMGANDHVPVLADSTLADIQQSKQPPTTFQITPAEQQVPYQVARSTTYTVPWTYFVLSPLSTVTAVADQQLLLIGAFTFFILVLGAIIGLLMGQQITKPILHSVEALRKSSVALKTLSTNEQSAATEQKWVIEASQAGLQKVEYYARATDKATQRLNEISMELMQHTTPIDSATLKRVIEEIIATTNYIEKARKYQDESNRKLAGAIRVTGQVSEQLTAGATSASEAATQLEAVVNELRAVVGR